ncbi:MAG TPA: hypothetical protein PLB89_02935 [Flavobacteriales bacterium]|nr:hypothetical protein [Flavobacteriales bacterium]
MNTTRLTVGPTSNTSRSRGTALGAFALALGMLVATSAHGETCKVQMNGTNFTPPAKPRITTGTTVNIKVFGGWTDWATKFESNKNGITITGSNGVSGLGVDCNSNITLRVVVGQDIPPGEATFTLRGPSGSYTASFKVDIVAPPPPPPPLCGTAEGQLSMMLAKVVVATPAAPTVDANRRHAFSFSTELFKVAQPEATNTSCASAITLDLYSAPTSAALSALQNTAANDGVEALATPQGVVKRSVSMTRTANTFNCTVSILRGSMPAGTNYYRIAKRITKADGEDPYVFSTTYSFNVVNQPPVANAGQDVTITLPTSTVTIGAAATDDHSVTGYLWTRVSGSGTISSASTATTAITGLPAGTHVFQQRATDSDGATATDRVTVTVLPAADVAAGPDLRADGVGQVLYCGGNGTVTDGTFTYHKLPENFCTTLPELSAYVQERTLGAAFSAVQDKRVMRLEHPLPNMAIHYTNIGTAATGAGFNVQVLKGTSNTVLATIPATAIAAGATGLVNYTARDTAIVHRFPGFDGPDDKRFCYVKEELDHTFNPVYTKEKDGITIKLDPAAALTAEPSAKRTNNSKFISCGTTVVLR